MYCEEITNKTILIFCNDLWPWVYWNEIIYVN